MLKCVKDQNGNHVIQKAIERVSSDHIQFIIEAFRGQVYALATHPYGCRVIQRMIEYCTDQDQVALLEELHQCSQILIADQYGNYVAQHMITHGKAKDRAKVIQIVTSQLLTLSKQKFASNVVEKSIQFGTEEQRAAIVSALTTLQADRTSPLQLMMKDQYGNYVIRKYLIFRKSMRCSQLRNSPLTTATRKTSGPAQGRRTCPVRRRHETSASNSEEIQLWQTNRCHREAHIHRSTASNSTLCDGGCDEHERESRTRGPTTGC